MSNHNPELSIVILHYRNPAVLKLCLNSIYKFPPPFSYEVIVVDSKTYRVSRDLIMESYPQVKFIPEAENTGYARGVNIGIRSSSGKYVLVLNQDTMVTDGALEKLCRFIEDRPDVGLVGPQLLQFDGSVQDSYFRFYRPITIVARRLGIGKLNRYKKIIDNFLMRDVDPAKLQTPDWISGAAMLTTKDAISKVGLMDENFFFYFEDVDWAKRFWQNGYKVIYYPEAKVYHALGRGSKSKGWFLDFFFNKKTHWHIKSAVKYFMKYRNV